MRAFVRRITARRSLDRIDELDETDPFGASYHHRGPYEAIAGTQPAPPSASLRSPLALGPQRSSHPPRPQHQSAYPPPSAYPTTGLSLHLEPGQILQPNTIYSSHLSTITAVPPKPVPATRPDRRQSLPNPRTRHHNDSSPFPLPDRPHNRQPPSLRTPRNLYLGDYAPVIPNGPPPHHDHDPASYVHRHSQTTVFPPPRHEPGLLSAPPPSPQHTPPSSLSPTLPQRQSTENAPPPRRHSRHKTVHSSGSSHPLNRTLTQSSSSVHTFEPPRIRHLPKRLVMPAPLQPQPPPKCKFPLEEPPSWQYEYPDDQALDGAHFQGKPAMYDQEPRPLRKKSSTFPAKTPIPDHAPMSQNDAVPIMENSSAKTINEVEETKERTRRRKLSKRKGAI